MLGEGLTTAAPVQTMTFDENRFDAPPRRTLRRVMRWVLGLATLGSVATIAVLALR